MNETKDFIYHIISEDEWFSVKNKSKYFAASLAVEGFIHFSFQEQIKDVAARFYTGQDGLLLLKILASKVDAPLRIDVVENEGSFPHLYGPLNLDSVVEVYPLTRVNDDSFTWKED